MLNISSPTPPPKTTMCWLPEHQTCPIYLLEPGRSSSAACPAPDSACLHQWLQLSRPFVFVFKNKIQPSKCEDLIGFIKIFVNEEEYHLASRGLHKMEVFYRKKGGTREPLAKKERVLFRPGHLLCRDRAQQGGLHLHF